MNTALAAEWTAALEQSETALHARPPPGMCFDANRPSRVRVHTPLRVFETDMVAVEPDSMGGQKRFWQCHLTDGGLVELDASLVTMTTHEVLAVGYTTNTQGPIKSAMDRLRCMHVCNTNGQWIQLQSAMDTMLLMKAEEERVVVPAVCIDLTQKPNKLLKCSICMNVFKDPMLAADGHTYCNGCISKWVRLKIANRQPVTSPLTNLPLRSSRLISNFTVKQMCDEWRNRHR